MGLAVFMEGRQQKEMEKKQQMREKKFQKVLSPGDKIGEDWGLRSLMIWGSLYQCDVRLCKCTPFIIPWYLVPSIKLGVA
jgi:hypothetical protein